MPTCITLLSLRDHNSKTALYENKLKAQKCMC